jgi:hypothetical protein
MIAPLLALLVLAGPPGGGRVLSGRVLGPDAEPVAGAQVLLLAPERQAEEPRKRLGEASSGPDGRFELRSTEEGAARLFVRGEGAGVCSLALEAGSGARALGDLRLVGRAWLSGRAAFPDGRPAPDIELWAVPEAVATRPDALVACVEQALEHELDGAGLFSTRTRTGVDGSFRLAGLADGRYMLRCPRSAVVLEPRIGYYHATTENIALSVESPRLRVRALDPSGRELLGARVRLVELNEASGGRFQPGQVWSEILGGPLGCASFDVQFETAYGVRVEAAGFGVHEDLVLLAQNEYEQLQVYRLEPKQPPGRVRLLLKPVGGQALGPCEVELVSPLTLAPDPEGEPLKLDEQGWLPPLPPGRYLFALRWKDPPQGPNWYLPAETKEVLVLESKAERELALELALGGRFELALRGAPLAAVELRVEGLEGQEKCTLRFAEVAKEPARGLDLLPPGRYRIRASAPRCRDLEAEVRLEPGRFTRLELELLPR